MPRWNRGGHVWWGLRRLLLSKHCLRPSVRKRCLGFSFLQPSGLPWDLLGLSPAKSQQTPELEGCSLQRRAGCGCEGNKPAPHPGDTEANKIQFLSLRHSPSKRKADLEINYNLAKQVAKQRGSPNRSDATGFRES